MKCKLGRPTTYTPELAAAICDAIASSSKGIRRLSKENEGFPNPDTIYRWVKEHKDFSDQYAQAKRQQIEVIVDEIIEIADDTSHDTSINDAGKVIINHEHINRSRLRIDTRKWLASKLAPKIYGEKPEDQEVKNELDAQFIEECQRFRKKFESEY